jgi:hypothetical protein
MKFTSIETSLLTPSVDYLVKDNYLILVVNLSNQGEPSTSGLSVVLSSTHGNQRVPGTDVKVGLNVYRPISKEKIK